jgi:hypothetical protein
MIQKFDNKNSVSASEFDGLFLGLNNGDKAAIEDAVKRWNFKDAESLMKYVLAVLIKTEDGKLIGHVAGSQIVLAPSDHLLAGKPNEKTQ